MGHRPATMLSPQDETLFRAFQSNLLSLISHELRTPLAGILNALSALREGIEAPGFTQEDWVKMAHNNAFRLQDTLSALLDLASLESGTFHVRLKEVDLIRLVQSRCDPKPFSLRERNIQLDWDQKNSAPFSTVLADPQKLGRAFDLCLKALSTRALTGSTLQVGVSSHSIFMKFQLDPAMESYWEGAWTQSLVGIEGGVTSPFSAFAGVMQSEEAFLTRSEEGLGSEFLIIHEIMRTHSGRFKVDRSSKKSVHLTLELPELSSEEGLRAVLVSRAFQISTELASVGLILIQVPESCTVDCFQNEVRKVLFRSSDAVYSLPARRQIAMVLDDCKLEDAPRLMKRISLAFNSDLPYGMAHCPSDGLDPGALMDLAANRLSMALKKK